MGNKISGWIKDALGIFRRETSLVLHDSGVMLIFIAAGFGYPILYNAMYHNGVLEDTPIAVVDLSNSSASRRFVQKVDATRELDVAYKCTDMAEAEKLFQERNVNGIIFFPEDFEDKIAANETATLSIYADMSSFLYYKNLMLGANFVMLDEIKNIEVRRYSMTGMDGEQIKELTSAIPYEENNPYNRTFSYTIFFLSAVLLLVIQQVMFFGMAMASGTMRERGESFALCKNYLSGRGTGRIVLGRGLFYWLLFLLIGLYIVYIVPAIFGFPQRGSFSDMLVLLLIFVTDCVFFSMVWSSIVTRREAGLLLFLFASPILLFLTGFSWPEAAFPSYWKYFSYLFPTTFGCRAFINMNTAGADLYMVRDLIQGLLGQTAVYFLLACLMVHIENRVLKSSPLENSFPK